MTKRTVEQRNDLMKKLRAVLNGQENDSNTPDFILAEYMTRALDNWEKTTRARDAWYNVELTPAGQDHDTVPGKVIVKQLRPVPGPVTAGTGDAPCPVVARDAESLGKAPEPNTTWVARRPAGEPISYTIEDICCGMVSYCKTEECGRELRHIYRLCVSDFCIAMRRWDKGWDTAIVPNERWRCIWNPAETISIDMVAKADFIEDDTVYFRDFDGRSCHAPRWQFLQTYQPFSATVVPPADGPATTTTESSSGSSGHPHLVASMLHSEVQPATVWRLGRANGILAVIDKVTVPNGSCPLVHYTRQFGETGPGSECGILPIATFVGLYRLVGPKPQPGSCWVTIGDSMTLSGVNLRVVQSPDCTPLTSVAWVWSDSRAIDAGIHTTPAIKFLTLFGPNPVNDTPKNVTHDAYCACSKCY